MKTRLALILFALASNILLAAVPLRWTVETSRLQPVQFDAVRGETIALEASFNTYGTPLQLASSAAMFYQTNGMGSAWWIAPATVESNRISAVFAPTNDPGASVVRGFLGSTGDIYRAAFSLRFRDGPGATPNTLELPTPTIDCASVTFLNPSNAPWSTGGGSGGDVDWEGVTNAALAVAEAGYVPLFDYDDEHVQQLHRSTNLRILGQNPVFRPVFSNVNKTINYKISTTWYGDFELDNSHVVGLSERIGSETATISNSVAAWDTYWTGETVRLSVTNYYGNTSGESPRLRIEESVTNAAGEVESWRTVWDETTRQTNFEKQVVAKIDTATNDIAYATWQQTARQLAGKAPRAWGDVTSAGEDAPEGVVWHTAPKTVFAGGTEYAHVAVGEGTICVLASRGAPVYTEGSEGQFRFTDETGANYFGFDVRSSYVLGCRTDDIDVTTSNGNYLVTLTYDLTSASPPEILKCTNLTEGVWTTAQASWDADPPTGTQICYLNVGTSPQGFFKAQINYAGGSKFVTNMQADLAGGIAASNETLNVVQTIYPVVTSTGVVWRVKQ